MKYITFNNWDRFQHYTDGRHVKWIKLLVEIIDEFDNEAKPKKFFRLSDTAKLTFIMIACLRARFKDQIPYPSDEWLKQQTGLQRISIAPLEKAGYITVCEDGTNLDQKNTNSYKSGTRDRDREGDREREREKHTLGEFKHVKLSKDDQKKLIIDYGKHRLDQLVKSLDEYIEMTGKRYKNHMLTITRWASKDGVKKRTDAEKHEMALKQCLAILEKTPQFERERVEEKLIDNWGLKAVKEAKQVLGFRKASQ